MKQLIKRIALPFMFAAILTIPIRASAEDASTNAAAGAQKPGPNRFYGPVTKVDAAKMTFTVGDQTFKVVPESELTNKEGGKATLADVIVGEPARGTYTKKSDGTLDVTKVRFGKKSGGKAGGKGGGKKKDASATATQTQ